MGKFYNVSMNKNELLSIFNTMYLASNTMLPNAEKL